MAYTKTVWATGDIITADKLNNMEDGIEEHDPIILSAEGTASGTNWDFVFDDITFGDVVSAVQAGKTVRLMLSFGNNIDAVTVTGCNILNNEKVYGMDFSAGDVLMIEPEDAKPDLSDTFAVYIMGME